jgi:hypothetical protein
LELLLRVCGAAPWRYVVEPNRPTFHIPHPVRGWTTNPGHYVLPPYFAGGGEVEMTFLPDGRRVTAAKEVEGRKRLAILGCSDTEGWAVSDRETYAWKLQQQFPEVEVQNYGVAGYGTYQCLLVLEDLFAGPSPPALVVYAFKDEHELRSAAPCAWLRTLSMASHRGHVDVPYCTVDGGGRLLRHASDRYSAWPLREYSAAITCAESLYMTARTRGRLEQARDVGEKLLLEMDRLCRSHGVPLVVALVGVGPAGRQRYIAFFQTRHIGFVDSVLPSDAPDRRVEGDGHPNGKGHDFFVEHIAPALRPKVAALEGP